MHFVMWVLSVFPKHCLEIITIIVQRGKRARLKKKRARKVMANNCAILPAVKILVQGTQLLCGCGDENSRCVDAGLGRACV